VLNGKVLRVDENGAPWPTNPFIDEANPVTKKIFTYGHRNVQGLSARHRNQMWSAEHGTYRDDEVNKLKPGGNYGWNPVPGYDESKPMTDHSLPGRQIDAKWSSGEPTIATSGMAWLRGDKWGNWEGRLAVAALAGSELLVLEFSPTGELISEISVAEFDGDFGRLRAVELGPQNNLYVTTSNGGSDRILEVTP
jgi:glucose/arabinose dehydrogenase